MFVNGKLTQQLLPRCSIGNQILFFYLFDLLNILKKIYYVLNDKVRNNIQLLKKKQFFIFGFFYNKYLAIPILGVVFRLSK